MITWLVGDNSFEVREALKQYEAAFDGAAEYVDGSSLTLADLPDILMGISLFSSDRLVVIQDITTNSTVWQQLPDWLPRINDAIHIIFVDAKPDKRTVAYKTLKQAADYHEFPAWTDRDYAKAEQWVSKRAAALGVTLNTALSRHLVHRVGVNQWQLARATETVSLLDAITPESIDAIIPPHPTENIFQLFETALEGKSTNVVRMIDTLALQEDPYALFALLSSQVLSLAAVTYADASAEPTKDFGIHPFVASKLVRHGKRLGARRVGEIVELFASTDADMKRSKANPWLLIERSLLQVAQ